MPVNEYGIPFKEFHPHEGGISRAQGDLLPSLQRLLPALYQEPLTEGGDATGWVEDIDRIHSLAGRMLQVGRREVHSSAMALETHSQRAINLLNDIDEGVSNLLNADSLYVQAKRGTGEYSANTLEFLISETNPEEVPGQHIEGISFSLQYDDDGNPYSLQIFPPRDVIQGSTGSFSYVQNQEMSNHIVITANISGEDAAVRIFLDFGEKHTVELGNLPAFRTLANEFRGDMKNQLINATRLTFPEDDALTLLYAFDALGQEILAEAA